MLDDLRNAVVLLPGLIAILMLGRYRDLSKVVLNVYLPSLLLFPLYYSFRLPHLPEISFTTSVALVLAVAMLPRVPTLRPKWLDLWVLLFILGIGISETRSTTIANGGLLLFSAIFDYGVPYVIGRMLMEELQLRRRFALQFLRLGAVTAALCLPEYLFNKNLFQSFGRRFFPNQPSEWGMQMRWGHARVAGPYAHAILAGMMFFTMLVFLLWLIRSSPDWGRQRIEASVPVSVKTGYVILLVATLFMTQSRGPWIGAAFALSIALLGTLKNLKRGLIFFVLTAAIVVPIAYRIADRYTADSASDSTSEDKQSVRYRRELIPAYLPIIYRGGLFGWGIVNYPTANSQRSIDNEYLLLGVTQGYWGLSLFFLIMLSSTVALLRTIRRSRSRTDRGFAFVLLGILAGIYLSISTVFMDYQVEQLFFLLIGWSVSLRQSREELEFPEAAPAVQARFQKVYS